MINEENVRIRVLCLKKISIAKTIDIGLTAWWLKLAFSLNISKICWADNEDTRGLSTGTSS